MDRCHRNDEKRKKAGYQEALVDQVVSNKNMKLL